MNKLKEILFVDDVQGICTVFKTLVEARCKINVTTCNSGEEALRLLEHYAFDLLVTDIIMPGMDGIELTNIVLKVYDIPVVLTTGYNKDNLPSGFDEIDAVCCLAKPYTVTEISEKIRLAFNKKKMNDQRKKQEEEKREEMGRKADLKHPRSSILQELLFA